MNTGQRLSDLKKQKIEAERLLRDAQLSAVEKASDKAALDLVRERREALQLIEDGIAGLEEALRVEADRKAEAAREQALKQRREALEEATRLNGDLHSLRREIGAGLAALVEKFHEREAVGFRLLKTIQPHVPLHEFSNLKDDAVFPSMIPEWDFIVHELAAGGIPMPGMGQAQSTTFIQQHSYLRRADSWAERIARTLAGMLELEEA